MQEAQHPKKQEQERTLTSRVLEGPEKHLLIINYILCNKHTWFNIMELKKFPDHLAM